MPRTITFNQLRAIKAQLPEGSIHEIAKRLNMNVQSVRNYFGGSNYDTGEMQGVHIEPGPGGGFVTLDDSTILDMALEILDQKKG